MTTTTQPMTQAQWRGPFKLNGVPLTEWECRRWGLEFDSPETPVLAAVDPGEDDEDERKTARHEIFGHLAEPEIAFCRDELFANGSEFKATQRDEIIGIDNVLSEIEDVIHWLQNSAAYQRYNSRLEPGVIFEGAPGTGKTLVSRWIATASEAIFISVRDFPHTGALYTDADISDLFKRSRAAYEKTGTPVVLFWDEFENSAVQRDDCTPEQAQAVAQLTAELDGVHGKNEGILLVGCTNYMYKIDPALKRSGRMGLHIEFSPPDRHGKELLLDYYLSNYKVAGEISLYDLSFFFASHANAADIEEACMEAWRYAVRRGIRGDREPALTNDDLYEVFLKRLVGPPATFVNRTDDDRLRTAIHEVGHALAAHAVGIPLRLITVQAGKKSLGRVVTAEIDEHQATVNEYLAQIRVSLGSVVAEKICGMPASAGATGDIESASRYALFVVDALAAGTRTGLFVPKALAAQRSQYGAVISPSISTDVIDRADRDIVDVLESAAEDVKAALTEIGPAAIRSIAKVVNERVTLTGREFDRVVADYVV